LKRGKDGIFGLLLPGDAASGMTEEIARTIVLRQLALAEQGGKRWSVSLAETHYVGLSNVIRSHGSIL